MWPLSRRLSRRCSNSGMDDAGALTVALRHADATEKIANTSNRRRVCLRLLVCEQCLIPWVPMQRIEIGVVLDPAPVTESEADGLLEHCDRFVAFAARRVDTRNVIKHSRVPRTDCECLSTPILCALGIA